MESLLPSSNVSSSRGPSSLPSIPREETTSFIDLVLNILYYLANILTCGYCCKEPLKTNAPTPPVRQAPFPIETTPLLEPTPTPTPIPTTPIVAPVPETIPIATASATPTSLPEATSIATASATPTSLPEYTPLAIASAAPPPPLPEAASLAAPPPLPPPLVYRSPFQHLPLGQSNVVLTHSARHLDQIGSWLDQASLSALSACNRRTRWVFQARMKMLFYLKFPVVRDHEIGPSIGMSIVYAKKDGQPRLIKIAELPPGLYLSAKMEAVLLDTGKSIGNIKIGWLRPNGYIGLLSGYKAEFGYENGRKIGSPYGSASQEAGNAEIFIDWVDGSKDYSGVGTALMQAGGMEFGLLQNRNCNMRLWLDAAWTSHGFYWGLRMRINYPPYKNMQLACALTELWKKGEKQLTKDFGGYIMYLPVERAAEWRLRIKQDPVLYETRYTAKNAAN